MSVQKLLILPFALACLAAAPAPKAASPRPLSPTGPFDAQNPQGLMDLLSAAGAKVQIKGREADAVFVTVTSATANFSMQFAGCTPQGRGCRAVLLDSLMDRAAVTTGQINGFNQTSVMCRLYQDRAGQVHILYSALLSKSLNRDDGVDHLGAWQGCLAEGHDFLKDPVGYLANAA